MIKKKIILIAFTVTTLFFSCADDDSNIIGNFENKSQCEKAIIRSQSNKENYIDSFTEQNLELLKNCKIYKESLQQQIQFCGDPEGKLKKQIENLDCDKITFENCEDNQIFIEIVKEDFHAKLVDGQEIGNSCTILKELLMFQIENCTDNTFGLYSSILDQIRTCSFPNNILGYITMNMELIEVVGHDNCNENCLETEVSNFSKIFYDISYNEDTGVFSATDGNNYRITFTHNEYMNGDNWLKNFELFIDGELPFENSIVESETNLNNNVNLQFIFRAKLGNSNARKTIKIKNGEANLRFVSPNY